MNKQLITLLTATFLVTTAYAAHEATERQIPGPAERAVEKEKRAQEEEQAQDEADHSSVEAATAYTLYNTTHSGALHRPIAVTPMGDEVTLEDGAVWRIRSYDWADTRNWLATDQILVTQNVSWFSIYDYVLINQSSGATVQANLQFQPNYLTGYARMITGFNDIYNYIYLDDGSIWEISYSDRDSMMKWCLNDMVIIGVNDGWDKYSRPNILINATINQYLRTKCIQ